MKKIRILLAMILTLMLIASAFVMTEAEPAGATEWRADLTKLMNEADIPKSTNIHYDIQRKDGAALDTHDVACEISVNGVTYGCEFTFALDGVSIDDWAPVQQWLGGIVTEAARTDGGDSEALAKAIDKRISAARREAAPDADGSLPVWANAGLKLNALTVSTPFFPELKLDKNGDATKRLQTRLIELGFLSDRADGYFGQNTKAAVEALETYVRELEQDLIDARAATLQTAQPTLAISTPGTAAATAAMQPASSHELTLVPKESASESAAPTQTPAPQATAQQSEAVDQPKLEPFTPVDGVADAMLQAYLFSDSFQVARRALDRDMSGSDVRRLQTRLAQLGCSVDAVDGHFGSGTARSVMIFQRFNGLTATGVADMDTLKRLFSADATAPDHPMLAAGSSGDEVKALQKRLTELGFSTGSADGSYGDNTVASVKNLQTYLRNLEERVLTAQTGATAEGTTPDVSAQLTTVVNGIADPILLEAFYADSFPAVPSALESGSSGDDVTRLQRRLYGLEFVFTLPDGSYGAQTQKAVKDFQKRNGLEQTGVADAATLSCLFSGNALKALKPYVLKVSTADQRVYAYGLDANNEYTVLERTMKCSTGRDGTPTPKGTFQSGTGPGARWHYFKKYSCWAQYAYYIEGDILFHSVLYNQKDGPVTRSSVNNLGRKASHGCVRLSVEDAKWIYNNCPINTKVIVY